MEKQNKKGKKPSIIWFQVKLQPQPYPVWSYAEYFTPQNLSCLKVRNISFCIPLLVIHWLKAIAWRWWRKEDASCFPWVPKEKVTYANHSQNSTQMQEDGITILVKGLKEIWLGHQLHPSPCSWAFNDTNNHWGQESFLIQYLNRGICAIKFFRFIIGKLS